MPSSVLGGNFHRRLPANARAALQRYRQQKIDEAASEVAQLPDLLRVPRTVLAADMVEKFGLSKPEAYRAIFAAEREVNR